MKKKVLRFQRNIFIAVRGFLRGPFTPGPRCAAPPAPVVVTALTWVHHRRAEGSMISSLDRFCTSAFMKTASSSRYRLDGVAIGRMSFFKKRNKREGSTSAASTQQTFSGQIEMESRWSPVSKVADLCSFRKS